MLKHKYIDFISILIIAAAVILSVLFMNGEKLGLVPMSTSPEYAERLFNDSIVHTIELTVEDWEEFLEKATEEQYISCSVVIDGEKFSDVGIRAKGNNSLRLTNEYGLSRYSFKLEFDHFRDGGNYYGLDKLSLDSSFQDNSYIKTYLAYDMMRYMDVPSPLCSYAQVTVNGEPWGLYLAVEEPEEAFAKRCFGNDYGKLYKPDYKSLSTENADVALKYIDENPESYDNIFRNAKFDIDESDKKSVINALKILSEGKDVETVINIDEVLRYFAVQVFVINPDSYIGHTGHNYFLHEKEGIISIIPWDYNLAFGTYCLGMTDPITDPNILINYPINTPWKGEVMLNRPLFHNLMKNDEYFALYHDYMDIFISEYIESGRCEKTIRQAVKLITPYVKEDPTAFCSYEDFALAADTLIEICKLRGESIRGQLEGKYPITLKLQDENPDAGVDASHLDLKTLGDFDDLKD